LTKFGLYSDIIKFFFDFVVSDRITCGTFIGTSTKESFFECIQASIISSRQLISLLGGINDVMTNAWEKIKAAVDKGVADEDPSVLENYVGDFVFNPVFDKDKKQTTMRLDQPVEVLESGTGFMMIHRRAFEKFDACYGDSIKYKPDHVRTKNFDGSREISMYFQAEIDPETRRYLSEDYYFCQKIRKAGGKVWLAPWIALSHQGSMSFGGSLSHLASIGASATAGAHVPKR
jgi:hypothetical protein